MQKANYTSIAPKTLYYRTDGSGRDTYISFDNGGYFAKMKSHPSTSGPRPSSARPRSAVGGISAKSLHYHSDGTGRDKYVKALDGGLHIDYPDVSSSIRFVGSLRTYTPSEGRRTKPGDYFDWAQHAWTPRRARISSRDRKRQTDDCTKRLTNLKSSLTAFSKFRKD